MIYITQFVFVKNGKEDIFLEFEQLAIPLIEKYNGQLIYRLRPDPSAFVDLHGEKPYEIHFISFDSEEDFHAFMKDDARQSFIHLKNESVSSSIIIQGTAL